MNRAKIVVILLALVALLLPVAMPWIKTPLILGTAFGIAALGISILIISGQISFGHSMFVCAGGYAVAFVSSTVMDV
jgi:ABC-type branched-subunit amino acid transport system permease subunit